MLSELFYQYLNVEEDFITSLFTRGETQLGRIFVHEPVFTSDHALHVLDYERATQVIKTASHIAVGICYCRHKMHHMDRVCDAPMEICMTLNSTAASLIKYGIARQVEAAECLDLLQTAYDYHLVQFGENVRERVNFICNCCGCCCEAMLTARRFGFLNPIHTTNFLPEVEQDTCIGCGKCVSTCPVEAITLISVNDPHHPKKKFAKLHDQSCLGCGICVTSCPTKCLRLTSRSERILTPLNTTHRTIVMAIERGGLQDLFFDHQILWSHRALAAVLGVILRLPPIKQAMATRQVKSRYLEALIRRLDL
jgi:ferredoxin